MQHLILESWSYEFFLGAKESATVFSLQYPILLDDGKSVSNPDLFPALLFYFLNPHLPGFIPLACTYCLPSLTPPYTVAAHPFALAAAVKGKPAN